MRSAAIASLTAALVGTLVGCSEPTGLARTVSLKVVPLAVVGEPMTLTYRFVVTNESASVVWLQTCDQRVTPDLAVVVAGKPVDTMSGITCFGLGDSSPIQLAPQTTYTAERAIPHREGARYRPSLSVAKDRGFATGVRIAAGEFGVP